MMFLIVFLIVTFVVMPVIMLSNFILLLVLGVKEMNGWRFSIAHMVLYFGILFWSVFLDLVYAVCRHL